jgi:hypothetical protein
MFHQGAGIWRDGLRPGSGAADDAHGRDYGRGEQARARGKAAAKTRPALGYELYRRPIAHTGWTFNDFHRWHGRPGEISGLVLRRLAALGLAFFACVATLSAQDTAKTTVQGIARDWLVMIDRGDGGAGWDAAAGQFRGAITRERWLDALAQVRAPHGEVLQRAVLSTRFDKSFPGAPEGDYAFVIFRTSFAKRADGQETVTLEREADGVWRVLGYTIR